MIIPLIMLVVTLIVLGCGVIILLQGARDIVYGDTVNKTKNKTKNKSTPTTIKQLNEILKLTYPDNTIEEIKTLRKWQKKERYKYNLNDGLNEQVQNHTYKNQHVFNLEECGVKSGIYKITLYRDVHKYEDKIGEPKKDLTERQKQWYEYQDEFWQWGQGTPVLLSAEGIIKLLKGDQ